MIKTRLRWYDHVERRPINFVVRKVDQVEGSQITRGKRGPRKIIRKTITKDLEINEFDRDMIFDTTL